jgi:hypothetical protein
MAARIFWIFGGGLTLLAFMLMVAGGSQIDGIIDYRAWLLLAFGILAMAIGNFSHTSGGRDG